MEATKRKIVKHGNERWEIDLGPDEAGVRRRPCFVTEQEADDAITKHQVEVAKFGTWWAGLSPIKRQEAAIVIKQIEAAGLTLIRVWSEHQTWKKENAQTAVTPKPYEDAVTEWQRRKLAAGKSQRYTDEVCDLFKKFGAGRMRQNIHEILADDLEQWIDAQKTWGPSSKNTNILRFSSLWAVAIAKGWCSLNITKRLEPVKRDKPRVEIYPNQTVINILAAMLESTTARASLAPVVIGLFGCMRPEEISVPPEDPKDVPFNWNDIDLEHGRITVRPEVAKNGDQRTIRLQPNAIEWIRLAKKLENPLPPVNERRDVDAACELIDLQSWIRDGLFQNNLQRC